MSSYTVFKRREYYLKALQNLVKTLVNYVDKLNDTVAIEYQKY